MPTLITPFVPPAIEIPTPIGFEGISFGYAGGDWDNQSFRVETVAFGDEEYPDVDWHALNDSRLVNDMPDMQNFVEEFAWDLAGNFADPDLLPFPSSVPLPAAVPLPAPDPVLYELVVLPDLEVEREQVVAVEQEPAVVREQLMYTNEFVTAKEREVVKNLFYPRGINNPHVGLKQFEDVAGKNPAFLEVWQSVLGDKRNNRTKAAATVLALSQKHFQV